MSIYKTLSKPVVKPNPVVVAQAVHIPAIWKSWTKADWQTWAEKRLAGKAAWIDTPEAKAAWDALVQPDVKKPVPNLVNASDTSGMKPTQFSEAKKTAKRSPLVNRERLPVVADAEKEFVTIKPINKNVTSVDWLRVTTNDLDAFKSTLSELDGENGLLENVGFDVKWRQGKGLHGYTESASILLWKDNDYMTVGNLAYSEDGRNKGGMFELTGTGCKVLQVEYPMLWSELHALLTEYAWRISRADVALDMSGEYCTAMGYTVPKLMREAYLNGLFTSEKLKNPNFEPEMDGRGNWTPLSAGVLTPDTYNPLEHCHKGLTFYVGNRAGSDDFFRVYEKGKEILGKQAEPESIDRAWVRIEHEMSRKGSGRTIPLAVMLEPDTYFCAGRPKVREIMDDMRNRCGLNETQQWQKEKFEKEKSLMLSRKVHWARHTYGRTIHTMRDLGWDDGKIVNALMREAGLKEFIPDLLDHAPDEGETIDYLLDEDES